MQVADGLAEGAAQHFTSVALPCASVTEFMSMSPIIDVATARPSENCRDLVKHFEQGPGGGHAKVTYNCSANKCTIGWGHVIKKGEVFTYPMTLATADALMDKDLDRFDDEVKALLLGYGVKTLEQGQYDALVSMAFNTGTGIRDGRKGDFADSMLINYVAQGRMHMAADEFSKWVFGGGKVLPGLVRRRKCERFLFQTGELNFFLSK